MFLRYNLNGFKKNLAAIIVKNYPRHGNHESTERDLNFNISFY
jgi:hypothetical protein